MVQGLGFRGFRVPQARNANRVSASALCPRVLFQKGAALYLVQKASKKILH